MFTKLELKRLEARVSESKVVGGVQACAPVAIRDAETRSAHQRLEVQSGESGEEGVSSTVVERSDLQVTEVGAQSEDADQVERILGKSRIVLALLPVVADANDEVLDFKSMLRVVLHRVDEAASLLAAEKRNRPVEGCVG